MLMLFMIIASAASARAEPYYMCGQRHGAVLMEPPALSTCSPPHFMDESYTEKFVAAIYQPTLTPTYVTSFTCTEIISQVRVCDPFIGATTVDVMAVKHRSVSKDLCTDMMKAVERGVTDRHKDWTRNLVYNNDTMVYITKREKELDRRWCQCTTNFVTQYSIQRGQVGTANGKTVFGVSDGHFCKHAADGVCFIGHEATVIWSAEKLAGDYCPFSKLGTYEVIRRDTIVIAEDANLSLRFAKRQQVHFTCLNTSANFHTFLADEDGFIMEMPAFHAYKGLEHSSPKLSMPAMMTCIHELVKQDREVGASACNRIPSPEFTPLNAKLNFVRYKVLEEVAEKLKTLYLSMCRQRNDLLNTMLAVLRTDPTSGVRLLLRNSSYAAEWLGDVVAVWRCMPVHPTKFHLDGKVEQADGSSKCYKYMPVEVFNQTYFVLPGHRDIVHTAPEVPCVVDRMHFVVKNEQQKFISAGRKQGTMAVTVKHLPRLLKVPSEDLTFEDFRFTAPSIKTGPQALPLASSVQNSHALAVLTQQKQLDNVAWVFAQGSWHPEQVLKWTKGQFTTLGQWTIDEVSVVGDGVMDFVTGPFRWLKGHFAHVVTAVVWLLVLVGAVLLLYVMHQTGTLVPFFKLILSVLRAVICCGCSCLKCGLKCCAATVTEAGSSGKKTPAVKYSAVKQSVRLP